jgi:hypothetical protein
MIFFNRAMVNLILNNLSVKLNEKFDLITSPDGEKTWNETHWVKFLKSGCDSTWKMYD